LNSFELDQRIALLLPDAHDKSLAIDATAAFAWYLFQRTGETDVEVFGTLAPEAVLAGMHDCADASSELSPVVNAFYERIVWHTAEPHDVHRAIAEFEPTVRVIACAPQEASDLGVRAIAGCRDIYFTPETDPGSASRVSYLGLTLVPDHDRWFAQTRQHIAELRRTTADKSTTAVFGTGPSYSDIDWSQLQDSASIICNSIVKQIELFDLIDPVAVCAADPVFHSSYSAYAEEFRCALIEALRATNMPFFFPVRDLAVYLNHLPGDVHDRLAPIELVQRDDFVLDLTAELQVKSTANILTLLLLPLAFTLKEDVWIAGCDGKVASSDYFWQHAPEAQFGNRMDSVKSLFGGFFDIDYDDYYAEHSQTLSGLLNQAESTGKFARSLTPSYIPALRQREIAQPMGTPDLRARRPTVHEFGALGATLAALRPLGVSIHEVGPGEPGLREYLNRRLRPGYGTDWTPGLPAVAAFADLNDACNFLQSETSDIVVVSGVHDSVDGRCDAAGWPPHWFVVTWGSEQEPAGEAAHFVGYHVGFTSAHSAPGTHLTAYGFQCSTMAGVFEQMLHAESIA